MSEKGHSFSNPNFNLSNEESSSGMDSVLNALKKIDDQKVQTATEILNLKEENAQKDIELKEAVDLVYIDKLTGLSNRHYFDEVVEKYKIKDKPPAAMVVFDVDKFKFINDTYGHSEGDEVLKIIGECMNEAFRTGEKTPTEDTKNVRKYNECDRLFIINEEKPEDDGEIMVNRYGGDEIVLVVTGLNLVDFTDKQTKTIIFNRIDRTMEKVNAINQERWGRLHQKANNEGKIPYEVKITKAMSFVDKEKDTSLLDAFNRADHKMLFKKNQQRKQATPSAPIDGTETIESNLSTAKNQ